MAKTRFREPWQFRLEVQYYPFDDFDIYVREISYSPIEIETEQTKAGIQVLTYPVSAQPVAIAMTMRDHENHRVHKWFKGRVKRTINPDGTVNLPKDYMFKIRRFSLKHGHGEEETDEWEVFPTQVGEVTESRDGEGALEFPITFVQFRS